MIHIILTYNIDNASDRVDFVANFEQVLTDLGLYKEQTNQSTYFGQYRSSQEFVRDLHNAVSRESWQNGDIVTIYYPKVLVAKPNNLPDIGRHAFKSAGNKILNHIILRS